MDGLCRRVASQIKEDGFKPGMIVALARGGWFAGRVLCDLLDLNDLTSLKVEHYVGTAAKTGEAKIKYPLPDGSVEGKEVLVVDDIADTGESLRIAKNHVVEEGASEVKTATLQLLYTSKFIPDYFGEYMEEWSWVVFPWNFIEDMIDIISRLIAREKKEFWTEWDIKWGLYNYHQVDPVHLEIAQPGRFYEIMEEMQRRGLVKYVKEDGRKGWILTE
mgnify:CR=1 FL=1